MTTGIDPLATTQPPVSMWRTWPSHMPIDRYPEKGMAPMGKVMVVVLVNGLASLIAFLEMAWVVPNVYGVPTAGRNLIKQHVHSQFTSIFCKPWLSTYSHVWTLPPVIDCWTEFICPKVVLWQTQQANLLEAKPPNHNALPQKMRHSSGRIALLEEQLQNLTTHIDTKSMTSDSTAGRTTIAQQSKISAITGSGKSHSLNLTLELAHQRLETIETKMDSIQNMLMTTLMENYKAAATSPAHDHYSSFSDDSNKLQCTQNASLRHPTKDSCHQK